MTRYAGSRRIAGLALTILLTLPDRLPAQESSAQELPASSSEREQFEWLTNVADGIEQARQAKVPILVRCGGEHCSWCRKLDEVIAQPAVQDELENWVLVSIDVEAAPEDAARLGVAAIPALRILSATGQTIAAQNGYLDETDLLAWLSDYREEAANGAPDELAADGPPSAEDIDRLVRQLSARDPARREAAIRRLSPHAGLAAVAVAGAFAGGALQTRLSALELLSAWRAPIEALDPWRPETLAPAALDALTTWAEQQTPIDNPPPDPPPPDTPDEATP